MNIDKKTITEIQIGNQIWCSENLNISKFKNGDESPQIRDAIEWNKANYPAWCYYENDEIKYGTVLGKLYNFYAIIDSRGLAPEGWEIPSIEDYENLAKFSGKDSAYNLKAKKAGAWMKKKDVTKAKDEFGFSAIAAGSRSGGSWGSQFMNKSIYASFWTKTDIDERYALTCSLSGWDDSISTIRNRGHEVREKQVGCSVRIIKK